jgi:hypothetical protein
MKKSCWLLISIFFCAEAGHEHKWNMIEHHKKTWHKTWWHGEDEERKLIVEAIVVQLIFTTWHIPSIVKKNIFFMSPLRSADYRICFWNRLIFTTIERQFTLWMKREKKTRKIILTTQFRSFTAAHFFHFFQNKLYEVWMTQFSRVWVIAEIFVSETFSPLIFFGSSNGISRSNAEHEHKN